MRGWLRPVVAIAAAGPVLLYTGTPAAAQSGAPPPHRGGLLDVPYVEQSVELCGGAAAAMVMRYWGAQAVYAEDFSEYVRPEEGGIRAGDLKDEARERGWRAVAFRGSPTELRHQLDRGRPVIALLQVAPERYHYVVIVGHFDDRFVLHDPARAPNRVVPSTELQRESRAAGGWALLLLPSADGHSARGDDVLREDAVAADRDATSAPPWKGATEADRATPDLPLCAELLEQGLQAARADDLPGAARRLEAGRRHCPDSPELARELAGVRFRQSEWEAAAAEAGRGLALDPEDAHGWRLLAASRFMAGDRRGALRAWSRVEPPHIDLVEVSGLANTRHAAVTRQLGLEAGDRLTPGRMSRAERRLAELPAAASTRLAYDPQSDGSVRVRAGIVERPLLFGGWARVAVGALRAVVDREVELSSASPTGGGERLVLDWRPWPGRPSVGFGLSAPLPGRPGVLHVSGSWERESYFVPVTSDRAGGGAAESRGERRMEAEERRRATIGLSDWADASLRWAIGISLDTWSGMGTHAGLNLALEMRRARDRVAARAAAGGWSRLDGRPGFGAVRADLLLRSRTDAAGLVAIGRAGLALASAGAPRMLWPGAGTARARDALLRAHPLLEGGTIRGPAFGRELAWAGAEIRAWLPGTQPVRIGFAGFADLARAADAIDRADGPLHVDLGLGLRAGLLAGPGALRLDLARGVRDGRHALSIGWEGAGLPARSW